MLIMDSSTWIENTYLWYSDRSNALQRIDKALLDYEKSPGCVTLLSRIVDSLEAWQAAAPENAGVRPTTKRNQNNTVTMLISQVAHAKAETLTATRRLREDTEGYLRENMLDCTRSLETSVTSGGVNVNELSYNYQHTIDYVLSPLKSRVHGLNFGRTPHVNQLPQWANTYIRGRYMGFMFNVAGPAQIAYVNVDAGPPCDFIFTVGLSGCTIVAVRMDNGQLCFYHEPTRANNPLQWANRYPGQVILRAAPLAAGGMGSAVIFRGGRRWRVGIQSFNYDQARHIEAMQRDAALANGFSSGVFCSFANLQRTDFYDVPEPARRNSVNLGQAPRPAAPQRRGSF